MFYKSVWLPNFTYKRNEISIFTIPMKDTAVIYFTAREMNKQSNPKSNFCIAI